MDGYKSIDITVPIWSNGFGTATVQGIPETRQNETIQSQICFWEAICAEVRARKQKQIEANETQIPNLMKILKQCLGEIL